MKSLLLLPVLACALLFSGCEATVVEGRPRHVDGRGYGYGHRDFYDSDRGRDYRYRTHEDDRYYDRSDSYYRTGYVSTRPVYVSPAREPYRGNFQYERSRAINRSQAFSPRAQGQRAVIKVEAKGHKKSHKDDDDRKHR